MKFSYTEPRSCLETRYKIEVFGKNQDKHRSIHVCEERRQFSTTKLPLGSIVTTGSDNSFYQLYPQKWWFTRFKRSYMDAKLIQGKNKIRDFVFWIIRSSHIRR